MKSKYDKDISSKLQINLLTISKSIFLIFLLYMHWYKEIWGDISIVLYGSVILLTVSLFLPIEDDRKSFLNFECMTNFYIVLLVFGIYCFTTGLIVSINRSLFLSSMSTYFSFLIVLFDCCEISKRSGSWEWLLNDFIIVAFICVIYTLLFGKPMQNGGTTVITLSYSNNPHSLAFVFFMGIFGLTGRNQKEFKYFPVTLISIAILSYGILVTGSRKTLISSTIFLCLWIILIIRSQKNTLYDRQKLFTLVCIFFAVMIVGFLFIRHYVQTDQFERLMRLFTGGEDSSNETRVEMYMSAWEIWKGHPIFGIGFNQYRVYSIYNSYSHSTYAEVLACTGLIGSMCLFVPFFGYLFKILRYAYISHFRLRYYCVVCLAGLLVELFLGIGEIWIYGFSHELLLLTVFGVFDYWVNKELQNEINMIGGGQKCKYLI